MTVTTTATIRLTIPQLNLLKQLEELSHTSAQSTLYLSPTYPPAERLEQLGFIKEDARSVRRYRITNAGKAWLREHGHIHEEPTVAFSMYNQGLHPYRFKDNPEEERFARAWEAENGAKGTPGSGRILAHVLTDGSQLDVEDPAERDRVVAATVIQWLGSPVGQCFLRDLGYRKKEE